MAVSADAGEVNREIVDLKLLIRDFRQRDLIQDGTANVDYLPAHPADQMVVPVNSAVETHGRAGMVQATDDSHVDQDAQDTVHGRPGKARNASNERLVDLIGRRVIVPFEHRLEDIAALHRQGQSPVSAKDFKLSQSRFDVMLFHRYKRW